MGKIDDLFSLANMSNGLQSGGVDGSGRIVNQLCLFEEKNLDWRVRFNHPEFKRNPGVILLKKLTKYFQNGELIPYQPIGINGLKIVSIIEDKSTLDHITAAKLAPRFKTSTQYWLDLQSCYDAQKFLRSYPVKEDFIFQTLTNYIKLIENRSKDYGTCENLKHPGEVLLEKFLKPSSLHVNDWSSILMVSKTDFANIIAKKFSMQFEMIVMLCKIFKTQAQFWLDIQNGFYSFEGEAKLRKLLIGKKVKRKVESSGVYEKVKGAPLKLKNTSSTR